MEVPAGQPSQQTVIRQAPADPVPQQLEGDALREYLRQLQRPRTVAPEAGRTGPLSQRQYTVQRGDSLTAIARKVLNDDSRQAVDNLYKVNKDRIASPDDVKVGMVLVLPG